MPARMIEMMDAEAVSEQLELCRFRDESRPSLFTHSARTRILILGVGDLARELYRLVHSQRFRLTDIVGALAGEHEQNERGEEDPEAAPRIIGTHEQVTQVVKEQNVNTIVVCLENRRSVLPIGQLLDLKAVGIEVLDGHQLFEEVSGRLSVDSLRPSALIFSSGFKQHVASRIMKRFIDVLASLVGLLVLLPLFVLVAILVKADSPGPVFYRQVRVGSHGCPFMIWKFRSMRQDAEQSGPRWAQADDPRISRVGRWLRKTRVDELPQLINVLKGEMSLVGPRPERPVFVQVLRKHIPYYDLRHTVRPGITGWAQVKFRYGASAEDSHMKLQYDLYYVKWLSFRIDASILMQTLRVIVLGEGAR